MSALDLRQHGAASENWVFRQAAFDRLEPVAACL